jgi:hypothetical protein
MGAGRRDGVCKAWHILFSIVSGTGRVWSLHRCALHSKRLSGPIAALRMRKCTCEWSVSERQAVRCCCLDVL